MIRVKTFLADGSNPNGRLFAGDLNAIQDAVAALNDLTQALGVGTIAIGESGLQVVRFAALDARVTGALRTDGILRGLGGIVAGAFTTSARNAITSPPYGLVILNTDTNQYEWNKGTPSVPVWSAIGNQLSAGIDVLANRPAASAVVSGSTYFATDMAVQFISNGSAWSRTGLPAGATLAWHSTQSVPTGWVTYDGGTLPGSTGIYADLYAHLGSTTTKPDTRGRTTVGQGSHADVDSIGDNDGVTLASRTPVHQSTNGLTLPNHVHGAGSYVGTINDPASRDGSGSPAVTGPATTASGSAQGQDPAVSISGSSANPSTLPAIAGTIGPAGSRPLDTSPFITALKIAKL